MIVAVELLYNKLYKMFVKELMQLNIGCSFNKHMLWNMNELVYAIDYIENGHLTSDEIIKIIQYYEEN